MTDGYYHCNFMRTSIVLRNVFNNHAALVDSERSQRQKC